MSSYCDVFAGKDRIITCRSNPSWFLIDLFNECDKVKGFGSEAAKTAKRYGLVDLANWLEEDEENEMVLLIQKASVIKKRLSIYGFSDKLQSEIVKICLDDHERLLREWIKNERRDKQYRNSLEKELSELKDYRKNGDDAIDVISRIRTENPINSDWILNQIPDEIIFYSAVKNLDDDDCVIIDYSEFGDDECPEDFEFNRKSNNPIIIVEGKNDLKVLNESLKIIYPELVDNITFLDIANFNIEGSAGDVVKMIKSFAGAGIKNRILAILDNDTAAQCALRAINGKGIKLPNNIKIVQYPEIELLLQYPTVGPQGESLMNINGLAGSIEMYLGKEALTNDDGKLERVMWRGYMQDVDKYQGALINKNIVNKRFDNILKKVKKDNYQYDFSDLTTLWDFVISELATIPVNYDE